MNPPALFRLPCTASDISLRVMPVADAASLIVGYCATLMPRELYWETFFPTISLYRFALCCHSLFKFRLFAFPDLHTNPPAVLSMPLATALMWDWDIPLVSDASLTLEKSESFSLNVIWTYLPAMNSY